jgi:hypothetical protein
MAGPDLRTKDDVPLYEIGDTVMEMMEVFREDASQGFIDRFSQEVDSRTFLARTGDMTWEEVAELEHAQTGSIDDYQMAFNVKSYAKSLGLTREFIEDSTAEFIEDHAAEIIAGGRDKMFDVTFSVLKDGIADGSELWYDPEDYGVHSFDRTHNHTYTGLNNNSDATSKVLFDDTSSHTPTEIVRELNKELEHHGYQGDTLLVDPDFADYFVEERSEGFGSQYHVPAAEQLVSEASPEDGIRVDGVDIMKTHWLEPDSDGDHSLYLYDSEQNPVKRNTVRPMEITDNSGAPVGGAGGFRGDPGALLGTYGSMRFGTKFADPLAGVTVDEVQDGGITLQ